MVLGPISTEPDIEIPCIDYIKKRFKKRHVGLGYSLAVEHWTHEQKVTGLIPSRISGRFSFSRVHILC